MSAIADFIGRTGAVLPAGLELCDAVATGGCDVGALFPLFTGDEGVDVSCCATAFASVAPKLVPDGCVCGRNAAAASEVVVVTGGAICTPV